MPPPYFHDTHENMELQSLQECENLSARVGVNLVWKAADQYGQTTGTDVIDGELQHQNV